MIWGKPKKWPKIQKTTLRKFQHKNETKFQIFFKDKFPPRYK